VFAQFTVSEAGGEGKDSLRDPFQLRRPVSNRHLISSTHQRRHLPSVNERNTVQTFEAMDLYWDEQKPQGWDYLLSPIPAIRFEYTAGQKPVIVPHYNYRKEKRGYYSRRVSVPFLQPRLYIIEDLR
jgi:hypothetical protein